MKQLLFGVVLGLLTACAGLAPSPDPSESAAAAHRQQRAAQLAALDDWRLSGRIAVQRADKGFSADLLWRQSRAAFDLRVMAPLNGGTFALSGDERAVALVTPKGEAYTASDAESLMRQHLGWALPLGGVRYWVRGLPDPGSATVQEVFDDQGRWTDFAQDGWRISILEYGRLDDLALPKRLFLVHDDLQVRFFIKQWERR